MSLLFVSASIFTVFLLCSQYLHFCFSNSLSCHLTLNTVFSALVTSLCHAGHISMLLFFTLCTFSIRSCLQILSFLLTQSSSLHSLSTTQYSLTQSPSLQSTICFTNTVFLTYIVFFMLHNLLH